MIDLLELIYDKTHNLDDDGNDRPDFCFIRDLVDDGIEEIDVISTALENGYKVLSVEETDLYNGDIIICADGCSEDRIHQMYMDYYDEDVVLTPYELPIEESRKPSSPYSSFKDYKRGFDSVTKGKDENVIYNKETEEIKKLCGNDATLIVQECSKRIAKYEKQIQGKQEYDPEFNARISACQHLLWSASDYLEKHSKSKLKESITDPTEKEGVEFLFHDKQYNDIYSIGRLFFNDSTDFDWSVGCNDYDDYMKALAIGYTGEDDDFYDFLSLNGWSEADYGTEEDYIELLKDYYNKYEYLGTIDYNSSNPKIEKTPFPYVTNESLNESSMTLGAIEFEDGFIVEYEWEKGDTYRVVAGYVEDSLMTRQEFDKQYADKISAKRAFDRIVKKHREESGSKVVTNESKKSNELKDRAKKHKKTDKKGAKGWFVNPNAGDVEHNVAFFNNAMGNSSEGSGLGEDLGDDKKVIDLRCDRQDFYDWVEITLANDTTKKGTVHIYTYLNWVDWRNAVQQLVGQKYGYNINYKEILKGRDFESAEIIWDDPKLNESIDDDIKPFTFKQIRDELKVDTNNFKQESGEFTYYFEVECDYAIKVLQRHYKHVDYHTENGKYYVEFSKEEKLDENKKKLSESSREELNFDNAPYFDSLEYEDLDVVVSCDFVEYTNTSGPMRDYGDTGERCYSKDGRIDTWTYYHEVTEEDYIEFIGKPLSEITQSDIDNIDEDELYEFLLDKYLDDARDDAENNFDQDDIDYWFDDEDYFYESLAPSDYNPKKTGKAYKVFKVKNGKLYPPMVANPGGADTPIGVWLMADEGEFAGLSKTGRPQVKSTGSGTLAYRPGWHLGDLPIATQFYRTNKQTGEKEFPKDFIWAECDYVMDIDYQPESDEQGHMRIGKDGKEYRSDKYQHSLAGLKKLPKDGYYKYRTNPNPDTVPWVITGAMKVNKLLNDKEVEEILNKAGVQAPKREGGELVSVSQLGLNESLLEGVHEIQKHDTLNPKLWNEDNSLKDEVKNKLLEITRTFLDELAEDEIKINVDDIILVGSNCSYNYNDEYSDLDVHIRANTKDLSCPDNLYPLLYSAYRSLFNKKLDIDFYGIPVEIYVETEDSTVNSNGVYSLNTGWIKEPMAQDIPEINQEELNKSCDEWENRYFELKENSNATSEDVADYIEDIYDLRKSSIAQDGEYAIGNLIFKEMRGLGYLDDLKELKNEILSKELSL